MKKVLLLITIAGLVALSPAYSQPQEYPGRGHGRLLAELKLADAQQKQFEKTRYETRKKQIELRAKIAMARLELQHLMEAGSPDKSSLEKIYGEIAALQTAMKMNHFNAWSENNKVLTPEQQKIWKKALVISSREMRRTMHGKRRFGSDEESPRRGRQ